MFAVIAESRDAARRAAELADVDYEVLPHALDALSARDAGMPMVTDPLKLERGDVALDASIALYERGAALKKRCEDELKRAEEKVAAITLDANGQPTGTQPLDAG